MDRLKRFLCTMDPYLATLWTITLSLMVALVCMMGFLHVLAVFGVGIVLFGVLTAIGIGIYKLISHAQSKCKEG